MELSEKDFGWRLNYSAELWELKAVDATENMVFLVRSQICSNYGAGSRINAEKKKQSDVTGFSQNAAKIRRREVAFKDSIHGFFLIICAPFFLTADGNHWQAQGRESYFKIFTVQNRKTNYEQISNYCRLITLNSTDTACLTMKNYLTPSVFCVLYGEDPPYR